MGGGRNDHVPGISGFGNERKIGFTTGTLAVSRGRFVRSRNRCSDSLAVVTAGYSGTPLTSKLGIKPGFTVALLDEAVEFRSLLDPLPAGVTFRTSLRGRIDLAVAFTTSEGGLRRRLPALSRAIVPDSSFWIAWPKQTSPLATKVNENLVREYGLDAGAVDVKVCAIDADWSGLKFVHRLENRVTRAAR